MFQNSNSKKAVAKNKVLGITELIIGGIFSLVFIYLTISSLLTTKAGDDITALLLGIGTIIFIMAFFVYITIDGVLRVSLIKQHKAYYKVLCNEQSHSIDQLAQSLDTPAPILKKRLGRMLSKGYLAVAYIDDDTNRIICSLPK